MNYGPLEFAAYLRRTPKRAEPAPVRAARAASPGAVQLNRLTIISGTRASAAAATGQEPVDVYEAVALSAPRVHGAVRVGLKAVPRPAVLVLSSHVTVQWQLTLAPAVELEAVLLSGYGDSTVTGAGAARVARIGGFYAFKRGSPEFKHLQSEVLRCTGRAIENFVSQFAAQDFELG
jgi:hypothetical protein